MKHVSFLIIATAFFTSVVNAQIAEPTVLCPLPTVLHESSGIEIQHANSIWTHNDSGDSARIFNIDTLGNILRSVYFNVDTAVDCEESTRDAAGNYYLGDFGNNLNNRTNLRIYKIPDPDTTTADTVVPQLITFRYPDQTAFPPDSTLLNFDCEAMFHFHDSLYLFSKNRGTSTFCRMYRLPDQPGDYVAELVDSFNTGSWVTSADISPSGQNMVLLSESRLWLFTDITGSDFFGGNLHSISMYTTQKEAVVFVNDSLIYMTDEYFLGYGGKLYKLDLRSWYNGLSEYSESETLNIFPNPANDFVHINFPQSDCDFIITVLNIEGRKMLEEKNNTNIDISALNSGLYFIQLSAENRIYSGVLEKE